MTNRKMRSECEFFTNTTKRKGWGLKMDECKRGIQSLIDMVKNGNARAALILKEIDNLLDECEMIMLKKKDDC
ncbi:hypothetical protein ACTFOZ_15760 [Bacillus cereus group sp. MYBK71-2]|uniref:hypothetical protein n=1 Tax=Bacillus cereus group sp. MYBK71-2 TaxID=3450611 RepID=UPI003F7AC2EE